MKRLPEIELQIGENDRALLNGVECRKASEDKKYLYFYEIEAPEKIRCIARAALPALIDEPKKFRLDQDYYVLANIQRRSETKLDLIDLSVPAAAQLQHKYELVMSWRACRETIPWTEPKRNEMALERVYWKVAQKFLRREVRSSLCLKEKPVTLETLLEWDQRLRAFDDDPSQLIDSRTKNSGNRTPRFTPEEERYIAAAINEYLQRTKKTIKKVHRELSDAMKAENIRREHTDRPVLRCLHIKSFEKRIGNISKFIRYAARLGLAEAEKHFRAVYGGQGCLRPGQRMEVDGWVCHLHVLVSNSRLWKDLPAEVREKLMKVRITFIVVIDYATRSILGIRFSWSESADAIRSALRMAMEDKTKIAQAFGCKTPWPQFGWGNWVHDSAAPYSEAELVEQVLKGMLSNQHSVVGVPWLRGAVEAFFRTIAADLLSNFMGQTGSNVVDRSAFQNASQAMVSDDELVEKAVYWLVEQYHNEVHPALGLTPLQAWYIMSRLEPPRPRHGPVKLIELFGHNETPTLTHTGIRVANFQFQSPELALMRRELGRKAEFKVTTIVDYENLGQILVKVPDRLVEKGVPNVDGWMLVSGPEALANVSLRQVEMANDDLARRFGYDTATSENHAFEARQTLLDFANEAIRARLVEHAPSQEYIEKRMKRGFHPALAIGDQQFRKELSDTISAPIALDQGLAPLPQQPETTIEISFEDSQ